MIICIYNIPELLNNAVRKIFFLRNGNLTVLNTEEGNETETTL